MSQSHTLEVPVKGMDCTECARHVQQAIAAVPGVSSANVFFSAEKAVIQLDPSRVDERAIRRAITEAGYSVPAEVAETSAGIPPRNFTRQVLTLFGLVFGAVLLVVVVGEWLGLFETFTERVSWPVGLAIVIIAGYPVFRSVIRAALKKQVTSHTLMTVGVMAALVVGEWTTAVIVVFFMRIGDFVETFTAERARRAVRDLTAMAPQTARVERDGVELELSVDQVDPGETVIVRPGEKIPVDGQVMAGQATVNQAAITGESMPVEVGPGAHVYAASLAQLGSLRVRSTQVGPQTTFGRVVKLVEEAEAHRAEVQRVADKFSAYYLPVVVTIAALTFLIRRDPLATAAVLVVACSCAFALATPMAMLASIGAGAKRGLLIKGGKYLELLARADVLLVDKTGTLTLGRPQITQVHSLNGLSENHILALAASAERYSEHPLAEAVRAAAKTRQLALDEPEQFEAVPGLGVKARIKGHIITVGSRRMMAEAASPALAVDFEAQGKTVLLVEQDGATVGILAAEDTPRQEVPAALRALKALGIKQIEILTGDTEQTAAALVTGNHGRSSPLAGVRYRANLLPEDKIAVVKAYQASGHTVIMVGDGVNDAPALAQADVGIALGAAGTDIAVEAGHVTLMRDDWLLVPELLRIAQRTMRVVKLNIAFTAVYNLAGLSLAALGFLPPVFAAAAQSLPDLGILANSSRLLRQK